MVTEFRKISAPISCFTGFQIVYETAVVVASLIQPYFSMAASLFYLLSLRSAKLTATSIILGQKIIISSEVVILISVFRWGLSRGLPKTYSSMYCLLDIWLSKGTILYKIAVQLMGSRPACLNMLIDMSYRPRNNLQPPSLSWKFMLSSSSSVFIPYLMIDRVLAIIISSFYNLKLT